MAEHVLKMGDLTQLTRMSESTIRRQIKTGEFPAPVRLGLRAVGWLASDIEAHLQKLKEAA